MKKIFIYTLFSFLSVATFAANELNEKQSVFRRELFSILGEEGFNPDIDKDGDIKFEYENVTYYVSVDYRWTEPFLVTVYNQYFYSSEYTEAVMKNCISLVGQSKTVKLYCLKNKQYLYESELFCTNANTFKNAFKPMLDQIKKARAEVLNIVKSGVGDLNLATDKEKMFERAIKFYQNEEFDKSIAVFNMLANAGYAPSYRYMGESYERGAGVISSTEKMVLYYEKAIDEGDYWSAYKLANYYYERADYTKAYNLFLKCASNENENKSNALYMLGKMQELGQGTDGSLTQAIQSYRKSVLYSTKLDCEARLALMRIGEPVEDRTEFVDANKTMLMGMNSAKDIYNTGYEYENGLNKRFVSLPKAYAYYKAAADKGYTKAFVKMGEIYISKYYPFNDKAKSDKYYQKAFKVYSQKTENDGEACYEVGNMYKLGLGVEQSTEQAKTYFKKGAMANDKNASYEYALICKSELEYPDAFKYFKQAAESGIEKAMYELAILYEKGMGTETNRSKALEWYNKCADTNGTLASEARKALKRLGADDEKF